MSDKPKKSGLSWTGLLGILLTIAWIIYVVYEVLERGGYRKLELNALGDFLAGLGGPIALLWLVIGFFQQSAALRLQQEELRNQVEETKNLVKQATEQVKLGAAELEFAKSYKHQENQPRFTMMQVSSTFEGVNCKIENHGATVTDVAIECDALVNGPQHVALWGPGKTITITLDRNVGKGTELLVQYNDAADVERELLYTISANYTISALFPDRPR